MSDEAVGKSTQRLVKAIGDAATARVNAQSHMRGPQAFEFARDHRKACEIARHALEAAIESAAEHLRKPPQGQS